MSLDDPRVTTATDTGSIACQITLFYYELYKFIQVQKSAFTNVNRFGGPKCNSTESRSAKYHGGTFEKTKEKDMSIKKNKRRYLHQLGHSSVKKNSAVEMLR